MRISDFFNNVKMAQPELLKLTRTFNVSPQYEKKINDLTPPLSAINTPLEKIITLKEAVKQYKNISIPITLNYLLILSCVLRDSHFNEALDTNKQLYNFVNLLYTGHQHLLTYRTTGIRDIINIIVELDKNQELRTFFQKILNTNEDDKAKWDNIALKIDIGEPENKAWLTSQINTIKQQAEEIYNVDVDYSSFIHFIVGCKIYLHRMEMENPIIPVKKDNLTEEKINDSFLNLINTNTNILTKETGNTSCNGREIITYFMESEQIKTPKSGCSYHIAFTTPAMICFIHRQLNTRHILKPFLIKTYENLVPYTSFRPLFLKSLIETLRSQGAEVDSIFDPTGGWGGTILGAAISNVSHVIDCDPNLSLMPPKKEMVSMLSREAKKNSFNTHFSCTLIGKPIEDLIQTDINIIDRPLDMICFSPPFFNYEKYDSSGECTKNQSRKKYSGYDSWIKRFVPLLIQNSTYFLKENGAFAVQVSNTSNQKHLVKDFLQIVDSSNLFNQKRQEFIYSKYCGYSDSERQQKNYFYVFQKKYQLPKFILEAAQKIDLAHKTENVREQVDNVSTSTETNNQISNHTFFTDEEPLKTETEHNNTEIELNSNDKTQPSLLHKRSVAFFDSCSSFSNKSVCRERSLAM